MSRRIELCGVVKLKDCLIRSEYLIPNINENDKIPSWDGYIEVYESKNKDNKKSELLSRIPVQVKGQMNPNIFKEQIKYSVDKADLNNYLNDGGVMFFVVCVSNYDNYRIYYETLSPLKLIRYIKNMEDRNSISISLKTFPKDNIEEFTDIFLNFSDDINKQASEKILSINDFMKNRPLGYDSFNVQCRSIKYKHAIDFFLENEVTVYIKHSDTEISTPIDQIRFKTFDQDVSFPILIEYKKYYSNYKLSYSIEGTKLLIGNSTSILYPKEEKKAIFNFKVQGTLSQRIDDTKFYLGLLNKKYFTISGEKSYNVDIPFDETESVKQIEYFNKYLEYLLELEKTLSILKIKNELDFKDFTKKDEEHINIIISSILYNEPQDLIFDKEIEEDAIFQSIKICNIYILLLFYKIKNGKYSVINFFDEKISINFQSRKDNIVYNASIYLYLKKEHFLNVSNIDYDIIYKSFFNLDANEELFGLTNQLILNMIDAYDENKYEILLNTALKVLYWLIENDHITKAEIYKLNILQIIKRKRKLSDSEISQLLDN